MWSLSSASFTHITPAQPPPATVPTSGHVLALAPTGAAAPLAVAAASISDTVGPAAGTRAAVEGRGWEGSELASYCSQAGFGLYGTWDRDVCGFWHPAAVVHLPDAGDSGTATVAARLGPGLVLTDLRMSSGSTGVLRGLASLPVSTAAGVGPGPWTIGAGTAGATTAAAQLSPPLLPLAQPAMSLPLSDWPLCVACLPEGDLVTGSLRGHLSYYWKA